MLKRTKKQKHTRSKKGREFDHFITETKDFSAVIEEVDGQKKLKITSPRWYAHQINKFKVGDRVSLYISTKKPKRTMQQNRYYWGAVLPEVSHHTGEKNLERLHKLFAGMFLTEDIVEVLGERVRITKSTATLSKWDFSEYLEKIAAETGVELPPTESYFD